MSDQPDPVLVTDPDGNRVQVGGATKADQQARIDVLKALWALRVVRGGLIDNIHLLTETARDKNWDWLDHNCDPSVGQFPFVQQQAPNAGSVPPAWGSLTTFDKAEQLRLGVSLALVENIRISQAIDMLLDQLADVIARDDTVPAPPDR